MIDFYEHELRVTSGYSYTPVPLMTLGVYLFLKDRGISYEVMHEWDLPHSVEVRRGLDFAKEIGQDDICIIKAKVNTDDLFEIAKQTHGMTPGTITDNWGMVNEVQMKKYNDLHYSEEKAKQACLVETLVLIGHMTENEAKVCFEAPEDTDVTYGNAGCVEDEDMPEGMELDI